MQALHHIEPDTEIQNLRLDAIKPALPPPAEEDTTNGGRTNPRMRDEDDVTVIHDFVLQKPEQSI